MMSIEHLLCRVLKRLGGSLARGLFWGVPPAGRGQEGTTPKSPQPYGTGH